MPHVFLVMALLGSALGFIFSAVSTYDFVAHLDRQVHGLHCSFLPGVTAPDASGTSGCHATLMSPYSSVLRESVWGGIPIALPSMALFAFLLYWGARLALTDRARDPRATGFYLAVSAIPVLASLLMGAIAARELGAFCTLCVGIYLGSAMTALGAYGCYRRAQEDGVAAPLSRGALWVAALLACLFVGTSTLAYALSAPDFTRFVGSCGELGKQGDTQALITLGGNTGEGPRTAPPALLEVLDPLCPACRAFERRLEHAVEAPRRVLLFPLDDRCNWMVDRAIHPGACAISEALLCADEAAEDVLAWAFAHQEEIMAEERAEAGSAQKHVVAEFPALRGCVGTSQVRARLNRALRFAVDHRLPVLTPQLYVNGKRLCDADIDLGLDYMLPRLLSARGETP